MGIKPYVIRQGDYLTRLAHQRNFVAERVWSLPVNGDLRRVRESQDILQPGDVIQIPDERDARSLLRLTNNTTNQFIIRIPSIEIKTILYREDGSPIAGKVFRVEGAGPEPIESITDDSGLASFSVPINVHDVELSVGEEGICYFLRIGHLDPIGETSGVAKRLAHLGYLDPVELIENEPTAESLRVGIATFQKERGLASTGVLDSVTRDALLRAHGS